jgi:transformation/transcription domain-associated protein
MQDVYDQRCEAIGLAREEAMLIFADKTKRWIESGRIVCHPSCDAFSLIQHMKQDETGSLKLETMTELMSKVTPQNTLTNVRWHHISLGSGAQVSQFMMKTMATPSDLWTMRKQFGLQISSATFMTYIMCLSARYPSRFHVSKKTGLIHVSEMLPCKQ